MRFDVVLALYQRCSFRLIGQCEKPHTVERVTDWLHVSFLCMGWLNFLEARGAT